MTCDKNNNTVTVIPGNRNKSHPLKGVLMLHIMKQFIPTFSESRILSKL